MTRRQEDSRLARLMNSACGRSGVPAWGVAALGELSRLLPGRNEKRVARLASEGGSAILLLLPYYAGEAPGRNVSRHAVGDDYHRVAMELLTDIITQLQEAFPQAVFLPFVDASPIPEVEAAARAGLGRPGKNRQLITAEYGTRCFICEIVTDLSFAAAGGLGPVLLAGDVCGSCDLCQRACPTGALGEEGLDISKCRSHITQKKGALTPWETEQVRLGGLVWGCDICTDICPRNQHPALTPIGALREHLTPVVAEEALDALLPQKSYGWRGKEPLLRNLNIIKSAAF